MIEIEEVIYDLLQSEPFYAHFISYCDLKYVADKKQMPTAGISFKTKRPVVYFNTDFIKETSRHDRKQVLKHEILHAVMGHFSRFNKIEQITNIAMDCAINQLLDIRNIDHVKVSDISKAIKNAVPVNPLETAEYYYDILIKHLPKQDSQPSRELSDKVLDDHDLSDKPLEGDEQFEVQANIEKIKDQALKKANGKISSDLSRVLQRYATTNTLPWKSILRNFVSTRTISKTKNTRKKTHRRFEFEQPGKKKQRKLNIGVCLDTSGSISDESYLKFIDELFSLIPESETINVIQADCEIKEVKKVKSKNQIEYKRTGHGGTAYDPALKKCKELKCDAIIYFGDMDTSDVPENPGIPVLWVNVNPGAPKPAEFGYMINI